MKAGEQKTFGRRLSYLFSQVFFALVYLLTGDLDASEILRQKAQENMVAMTIGQNDCIYPL